MAVSDGGRAETHKKVLEPNVEIHDATRLQVNGFNFTIILDYSV